MYAVISTFTDLQDDNHIYRIGDVYPRDGVSPSKERVEELSSARNKLGCPLIKAIDEQKEAPKQVRKASKTRKKTE